MSHVPGTQTQRNPRPRLVQLVLLVALLAFKRCCLPTTAVITVMAAAVPALKTPASLSSAHAATLAAEKQVNKKTALLSSSTASPSRSLIGATSDSTSQSNVLIDASVKQMEEEVQKVVDDQLLEQGSTHERFYRLPLTALPSTDYELFYQFSILYSPLDVEAKHLRQIGLAAPSLSYFMECMAPSQNPAAIGFAAQKVIQCMQSIRGKRDATLVSADSFSTSLCRRCVNAELDAEDLEEGWRFCSTLKNDPLNLAYAALSNPRNWVSDPRATPISTDSGNSTDSQSGCENSDSGSACLFNALRFNSPTLAIIQQTLTLEERRAKSSVHVDSGIRKYAPMTERQLTQACSQPNSDELPSFCCGQKADRDLCLRLLKSGNGFRVRYDIGQVSRFEVLLPNWYPLEMIQHAQSDPSGNIWKPECSWQTFFGKSGVLKWAVRELVLVKDVREEVTIFNNVTQEAVDTAAQTESSAQQSNSASTSNSKNSQKESSMYSDSNIASIQVTTSPPGQWQIYGYGLQRLYATTEPEIPDDQVSPTATGNLQKSSRNSFRLHHRMREWRESACSKQLRHTCRSTMTMLFPVLLQSKAEYEVNYDDQLDSAVELEALQWLYQDQICKCTVCLSHMMMRVVQDQFKCSLVH